MIIVSSTRWYKKAFKISLLFNIIDHLMTLLTKIITMMGGLRTLFPTNSNIFPIYTIYTSYIPLYYIHFYTLTVYPLIIPPFIIPSFYKKKSNNKSKLINRQFFWPVFFGGPSSSPDGLPRSPNQQNYQTPWQACPVLTNFLSSVSKISNTGRHCPVMSSTD